MELITLRPSDRKLWNDTWELYENSFPEHERRRMEEHLLAMKDSEFHCQVAVRRGENGESPLLLALFFYWEHGPMVYIEHIAVNPTLRGQNIGSTLLQQFLSKHTDSVTILEIDPPVDEVAQRRLRFYRHQGFVANPFEYIHPSYGSGPAHPLVILSFPRAIGREEFDRFLQYMREKVLVYAAKEL